LKKNVAMNSDKSVIAHFVAPAPAPTPTPVLPTAKFSLAISVYGNGTTVPGPGSHTYDEGTAVRITASPYSGWRFYHWSGDRSDKDYIITVTMDSDKEVRASFIIYSKQTQFIVASSDFNSIVDLDGCKIGTSNKTPWQYAETALSTYGITCQPILVAPPDLYDALETGFIDAVLVTAHPWPPLQSMIYKLGVNLLPWSGQAVQTVTQEFPQMQASVLPPNTYSGQKEVIFGYAPR